MSKLANSGKNFRLMLRMTIFGLAFLLPCKIGLTEDKNKEIKNFFLQLEIEQDHINQQNKKNTIQDCKSSENCFYATLNELKCGDYDMAITTTCISNDKSNSDPYCFTQNVAFVSPNLRTAISAIYIYEEDKQQHISGAICLKSGSKFYVELKSTNLSNCHICEWSDYFDNKGIYIGSEKGMAGKTSFLKKNLSKKQENMFRYARPLSKIEIKTISR